MKKLIYILVAVAAVSSCQKDIDIDLNENNANIVIEANYTAEDSTVFVRITNTVNYFGSDPVPEINNAVVTIIDQSGVGQSVPLTSNGNYVLSNYIPDYNKVYTLDVVSEGVTYRAECKMPSPVQVQTPTYSYIDGFFGGDPTYMLDLIFLDPVDTVNFYNIFLTVNGEEFSRLDDGWSQDDLLTDGNLQNRPLFGGPQLDPLDTVIIELRSIDEAVFHYLNEAWSIVGGSGSAAPGNPNSNWDNDALGYFSAYSISTAEVVLP